MLDFSNPIKKKLCVIVNTVMSHNPSFPFTIILSGAQLIAIIIKLFKNVLFAAYIIKDVISNVFSEVVQIYVN